MIEPLIVIFCLIVAVFIGLVENNYEKGIVLGAALFIIIEILRYIFGA